MSYQQNPIKNKLKRFQSNQEHKLEDSQVSFFDDPNKFICKQMDTSEDIHLRNLIRQQEETIRDLTQQLCQEEYKFTQKYAKRENQLQQRILKLHQRLTFEIKRNQHLQSHLKSLGEGNLANSILQANRQDYLLNDI